MSRRALLGALILAVSVPGGLGAQTGGIQAARDLIAQAIVAMGGEARLTSLHSLALETIGHGFALEQSERPEGPWLTTYTQQSEIRDFDHRRFRLRTERRNWVYPQWSPAVVGISGEEASATQVGARWVPTAPSNFDQALALDPERLLLTAKAAADLHALPDEVEQKIAQHVVAFEYQGTRLRLSFNPWTHLPTMLEQVSNRLFGGATWGDVTVRRWYSFWTLEKGGLMYPRQTTTEWNGFPYADQTVQSLTVDGPVDESAFVIPDDVRAASKAAATTPRPVTAPTIDEQKVITISDTVVEIPGGFNVSLVRQPDGLVVIEGTTSPAYAQLVMAYAAKRFPGVPIKALVTTSDAWPHIGGVREYIAAGTPIYALDLNVSILTRVAQAPHAIAPDTLAAHPKAPVFRPVTEKTTIGTGDTQIVLVPLRGEIGERMMLAWLPNQHLLYSSDSIQRTSATSTAFFMPEMLREVQLAAEREHLTGIDRVFGMHLTPTPWTEVVAAIDAAMRH
jgi:glyoxylase-like metal-dependent hydrolase (beta-lactamase superfamily II)